MPETTNFFQSISMSLGLPAELIEIVVILFLILLLLFLIFVPLSLISIRKELSGINWKLGYIARFIKRDMEEQKQRETAKEDQWQF